MTKYPIIIFTGIAILISIIFQSCSSFESIDGVDIGDHVYQLAVPLVNTKATVGYLAEHAKGNVSLAIDPSGKATLNYNGEVLHRTTSNFFPPYPGLVGIPIPDTAYSFPVPFANNPEITKATFKNTKLNFYFEHSINESITVKMQFKNLFKDGQSFNQTYQLTPNGSGKVSLTTAKFDADGWQMVSNNNSLDIYYEAITSSGQKIRLDKAEFYFDVIQFAYMEGYIGYHLSPVSGSLIDISLFDKWKSGTFDFENPKVSIIVENAFGFPVRSKVNRMDLTSVSGNLVALESEFIEKGVDFNYPALNERGMVKKTHFSFDRNNSNIRDIFNEKTKKIEYDISAEINPEKDPSIHGFLEDKSYYRVNVAAEIPLQGSVNQVVVTDTTNFNPDFLNNIVKGAFKLNLENTFPMDLAAEIYILDENKKVVYTVYGPDNLVIPSPGLNDQGQVKKGEIVRFNKELSVVDIQSLKNGKYVAITGKINTVSNPLNEAVWIYGNNGLLVQMGALVDYQK